jgi:hypothetical protein
MGVQTESRTSRVGDTATARASARPLAYGEVRVGTREIVMGYESLPDLRPAWRRLFLQAAAVAGVHPDHALVVHIDHAGVAVDTIDFDDPGWPVRTRRVTPGQLRRAAASLDA